MSEDNRYLNVKNVDDAAKKLIERQSMIAQMNDPSVDYQGVFVGWRKDTYVGSLQLAYPDYSKEIVFLNKSTKPVTQNLIDSIKKLNPKILTLLADEYLNLDGRDHMLRRLENRLTKMTEEQVMYAYENPIEPVEIEF